MESKGQARETLKWTREHRIELAFPILRKIFFSDEEWLYSILLQSLSVRVKFRNEGIALDSEALEQERTLTIIAKISSKDFPFISLFFFGVIFLVHCHLYPRCQAVIKKNRIHSKNMHRYLLRLIFSLIIKLYICVIDCLIMRKTSKDKETSVYELDNCHAQEKKIESFLLSLLVTRDAKKLERVTVSF